eukprot:gb/GECG01011024.1/.p1 GENE.gb/GECG01011024.1/~~gb/GECG01011024.1/.p1  ORF type:complete len:551 (+),score=90.35 gb/GECG01011024.1/:1-1653(+)
MSAKSFPLVIPTIRGTDGSDQGTIALLKTIQYPPGKGDVVKVIKHAISEEQTESTPEGYVTGRSQLIKDLYGKFEDSTESLEAELDHAMVKPMAEGPDHVSFIVSLGNQEVIVKLWNSSASCIEDACNEIDSLHAFAKSSAWNQERPHQESAEISPLYFAAALKNYENPAGIPGAVAVEYYPRRYTTYEGAISHGTTFTHVPKYIANFFLNGIAAAEFSGTESSATTFGDSNLSKIASDFKESAEKVEQMRLSNNTESEGAKLANRIYEQTSRFEELVATLRDDLSAGTKSLVSLCHGNLNNETILVRPLTKSEHEESMEDDEFFGQGQPVVLCGPKNKHIFGPLWIDVGSFLASVLQSYIESTVRENQAKNGRMALVKPVTRTHGEKQVRKYVVYWEKKSGYASHMLAEKASLWNHMRTYLTYILQEVFSHVLKSIQGKKESKVDLWQPAFEMSCKYAAVLLFDYATKHLYQDQEGNDETHTSTEFDSPPEHPEAVFSKSGKQSSAQAAATLAVELGTNTEQSNQQVEEYTHNKLYALLQCLEEFFVDE